MKETKMRIRELAAWGLDKDEYRPADDLDNPDIARALVIDRAPFELRSPLVESSDYELQELFAEQESRADLQAEVAGRDWSPFFEVAQYRERWLLRDGYHRASRCLKAGISHLTAVIVRAQTVEPLGAVHRWFFPEEILFSGAPPWAIDFLNDALDIEYNRAPLSKMLRITVEETHTLRGTNL